jgi:hypothetical protein
MFTMIGQYVSLLILQLLHYNENYFMTWFSHIYTGHDAAFWH